MALGSAMYGDPSNPNQPMARKQKLPPVNSATGGVDLSGGGGGGSAMTPAATTAQTMANVNDASPAQPSLASSVASAVAPVLGMARRAINEAPSAASATPAFFQSHGGLNVPESNQAAYQVSTVNPLRARAFQAQDDLNNVNKAVDGEMGSYVSPNRRLLSSPATKVAMDARDAANSAVSATDAHTASLQDAVSQSVRDAHTNQVLATAGTALKAPVATPVAAAPVAAAPVAKQAGAGSSGSAEADPNAIPAGFGPHGLASALGTKQIDPVTGKAAVNDVYDNNSIARMQRRGGVGDPSGGDIGDQMGLPAAPVVQPQTIAAQPVSIRRSLNGDLTGSDAERQQRLSDVGSAISDLTMRGGGVNMRSKRELLGQLLGQKEAISKEGYDRATGLESQGAQEANAAAQAQARIAAEAGTHNADLGAAASEFNVGTGERRSDLARSLLIGGRQYNLDQQKLQFEQGIGGLKAMREQRAGELQDRADFNKEFMAENKDATPEQQQAAYLVYANQSSAGDSPAAKSADVQLRQRVLDQIGGGANFLERAKHLSFVAPGTTNSQTPGAAADMNDNQFTAKPAGGVSTVSRAAGYGNTLEVGAGADPGDGTHAPVAYLPQSSVDAVGSVARAQARRAKETADAAQAAKDDAQAAAARARARGQR